jgi:hypothetical protein
VTRILCDGPKSANVDTAGRLLRLYEKQGRPWDYSCIGESTALEEEDATLQFTELHNWSYKDEDSPQDVSDGLEDDPRINAKGASSIRRHYITQLPSRPRSYDT